MKYLSIVIKLVGAPKYLCWNSSKAEWFWGSLRLSEKFALNSKISKKLISDIGNCYLKYVRETADTATVVEWRR